MKRQDAIVEWVSQKRKVSVNELADHFQVSKVTIRKDLDRLEEPGDPEPTARLCGGQL